MAFIRVLLVIAGVVGLLVGIFMATMVIVLNLLRRFMKQKFGEEEEE
jgi:flagellar biosynthesis protein FliQ